MSNIGILYTGGTIGCTGTPLTPLSEKDFSTAFISIVEPIIQSEYSDCTIKFIPFGDALDSTNLQPSDWCKMAEYILCNYSSYDAFIVLHGTDTMAWTASALSFLLTGLDSNGHIKAVLSKPVIVTGAQLPLFYEDFSTKELNILYNTDAFQNVCCAFAAAYTGIPEVCLYFENKLFRGNRTVKTNASEFNAFSTPNYPILGEFGVEFSLKNEHVLPWPTTPNISIDNESVYSLLKNQLTYITNNINKTTVIPFLSFPAYYNDASDPTSVLSDMLSACIKKGVNGIILESYGEGNFPSGNPATPEKGAIYKTLETASNKGVILIDCTQVLTGVVNSNAYASGSWLADVKAVGAFDMTPISALVKLIYLTTLKDYNLNNWDQTTIKRLMITNFTGEIMDVNILDSRGVNYLAAGESILALDGSATLVNDYEKGPVLSGKKKVEDDKYEIIELWRAIKNPKADDTPGQLIMQGDGNLVFYNSSITPVYASDTVQTAPAISKLVLGGSYDNDLELYIYNYAKNEIIKTLYPS